MVDQEETAPEFTAPLANGDVETFSLSDALDGGPVVLAFFPGAFTRVCTNEMIAFSDRIGSFEEIGVDVYGVSADSPFALNEFRDKHDLELGLVSDFEKDVIEAFDVRTSFDDLGVHGLPKRAVFVIDTDGTVTYAWVSDDASVEPDYADVEQAAASVAVTD